MERFYSNQDKSSTKYGFQFISDFLIYSLHILLFQLTKLIDTCKKYYFLRYWTSMEFLLQKLI
jgi:hypothetical protein